MDRRNVVIFGATGMVGQAALRESLLDPGVERVLTVGRTSTGQKHDKLRELVLADLTNYSGVEADLTGYDACFFCLGISSAGMSESDYRRVTVDIAVAAGRALVAANPGMTFIFVSGTGTDSTGTSRTMWARMKGEAENAVFALPFKAVYAFRPSFIRPMHGITSRTRSYRVLYAVMRPLVPAFILPHRGGASSHWSYADRGTTIRTCCSRGTSASPCCRIPERRRQCIVSTDDEAYTHNTWVSRLAPVQANKMILRALDAGVADVRLAAALNRSTTTIRMSRTMLKDISGEALEILKDKPVATAVFALLKQVHPIRQMDMAELMCKTKNFSKAYAAGLVSRTTADMMAENAPPSAQRARSRRTSRASRSSSKPSSATSSRSTNRTGVT